MCAENRCSLCGRNTAVDYRCAACDIKMCPNCADAHFEKPADMIFCEEIKNSDGNVIGMPITTS